MGENVVFLVILDTCDVMYNWSISLLPPIVLDIQTAEMRVAERKTSERQTFCGTCLGRLRRPNLILSYIKKNQIL